MTDAVPEVHSTEPDSAEPPPPAAEHTTGAKVVVYVMEFCPFCTRIKTLLNSMNIPFEERTADDPMYEKLANEAQHYSFPMVVIDGRVLGGCDDACVAAETGKLHQLLDLPCIDAHVPSERDPPGTPGFLLFPPVANRWVVQGVGIQVFILSVIIIVWHKQEWAWWVCLGMAIDFLIRIFFGGSPSLLGSNAVFATAYWREELVPGPPKQFAAFVGLFFFTLATCLFHFGNENTSKFGGSIVVGIVAFFAFLEGFFNFCMGCFVYSYLVRWGIVSINVYRPYTDSIGMFLYSLRFRDDRLGSKELPGLEEGMVAANDPALYGWRRRVCKDEYAPIPKFVRPMPHDDGMKSVLDTPYKFPQTDYVHREKQGLRYITLCDFSIPLSIGGLAIVFRSLRDVFGDKAPQELWQTIAIMGGFIYACLLLIYIYKVIFFPRKVYMEFQMPYCRNGGVIMGLGMILYAWLLTDYANGLQVVLLWIGMVPAVIHAVVVVAGWTKNRQFGEHTNPGVVMPAFTFLILALVLPSVAKNRSESQAAYYNEAAQWFFGVGVLMFVCLFATTFYHSFTSPWVMDPMRPMVGLWMAGCFLCQLAYQASWGPNINPTIDQMFFVTGVFLFLTCLYLIYPGRWLFRPKFVVQFWLAPFALDIFALSCISYFGMMHHNFSRVLLWIALGFCGYANYGMLMHTLALIVKRHWPQPMVRGGPLMISKFIHEAMKVMAENLMNEIEFASQPLAGPNAKIRCIEMWKRYARFTKNHFAYEESIPFTELRMMYPGQARLAFEKHDKMHKQIEHIEQILAVDDAPFPSSEVIEHLYEHIDCAQWEEDHMGPLSRKNINLHLQYGMMNRIWAALAPEEWEFEIVNTVRYCPMHMWRLRFIKFLTWYLPEREQLFGKWLYRGLVKDPLGDAKYELIVQDLPELIPRDTSLDWTRYM